MTVSELNFLVYPQDTPSSKTLKFIAGLVAFVAQAKYDSIILELITLSSAIVLLVRVVLGYKRMNDRLCTSKLQETIRNIRPMCKF